jgi:precorrin-6B C5,15-methyltransferase / cobalt-precorrin-6B C5,C15-methyltransferase
MTLLPNSPLQGGREQSEFASFSAASPRWLSIVGIGEDGVEGLSPIACALIRSAELVFGGKRHLALAAPLIRVAARPWPTPFERGIEEVLTQRGRRICVLASGDPYFFGVGSVLARHVDPQEMLVMPAPSSFSLAAARLAWTLPTTTLISLHARTLDCIRPHLHPGAKVLALTSDGAGPAALAQLLTQSGFGASRLTVLERLGGPRESIRATTAQAFDLGQVDDLNLVAVEVVAEKGARVIARVAGLCDALFEHDGAITKREIRAVTLSSLAPCRGELLWDVGAGAGSVAIEWMLADPSMRAVAVEPRPDRAARIACNAAAFGVPELKIVERKAPAALADLPRPDAIFIGGGASDPGVLDSAVAALRVGGRLVINAVTLETESALIAQHARLGGELVRLAIARADELESPAASGTRPVAWRPALPITQWVWVKR